MKFTLSWLKEHLVTDAGVTLVAETLTRIGLEVESVENPAATLAAFRIARVLSAAPHPPMHPRPRRMHSPLCDPPRAGVTSKPRPETT